MLESSGRDAAAVDELRKISGLMKINKPIFCPRGGFPRFLFSLGAPAPRGRKKILALTRCGERIQLAIVFNELRGPFDGSWAPPLYRPTRGGFLLVPARLTPGHSAERGTLREAHGLSLNFAKPGCPACVCGPYVPRYGQKRQNLSQKKYFKFEMS